MVMIMKHVKHVKQKLKKQSLSSMTILIVHLTVCIIIFTFSANNIASRCTRRSFIPRK